MHPVAVARLFHLRPQTALPFTTDRQRQSRTVRSAVHGTQLSVVMTLGTALQHMQEDGCVYLDYNATTPIFPEVRRNTHEALAVHKRARA